MTGGAVPATEANHAAGGGGAPGGPAYLWGRLTAFGLGVALAAAVLDQAVKLWLLHGYDLASRGRVTLNPFFDLVLAWNTGISFSLFPQDGGLGQLALLAVKVIAVVILWIWLARAQSRLTAVALGLIIGGAVGNGIDRAVYGAVVDFVLFHLSALGWNFNWYVFNLADVAIVAGVAALLYEALIGERAAKAP